MQRRLFLGSAASAALSAAPFKRPLGVQLYTVRGVIGKQPKETIQGIAAIGFKEVEAVWQGYADLAPLIREAGMKTVSIHGPGALMTGNWKGWGMEPSSWTEIVDKVKGWGIGYLVIPYVRPDERGKSLDVYKKYADELNKGGEICRKAGVGLAYHNHAFEFGPLEGSTAMDTLMNNTDKKLVGVEMDVFWVSVAGLDPVDLMNKWKGRVPLVHLKDKKEGAQQMFGEGVPRDTFREVGSGTLDFAAILKAAPKGGVKHYFVEQDQTPGDPLASIRKSYQAIRALSI